MSSLVRHIGKTSLSGRLESRPIKKLLSYHLLRKIGSGAIANVYTVYNCDDHNYYAVKKFRIARLQRMPNGISQLQRELLSMKRLSHPNIAKLHTILFDSQASIVYAVLELGDCGSLDSLPPDLPISLIRNLFSQVLEALLYLHSQKLVHGDIKPSNILLHSDGRALVSDFGIGHSFQSADKAVGSPAFQAPESASDSQSEDPAKRDVWSVGISLYQMIFRRLPFEGSNVWEIMENITKTKLLFPEDCDPLLRDLLIGMLVVDPKDRLSVKTALGHPWFYGAFDEQIDLGRFQKGLPFWEREKEVVEVDVRDCGDAMDFIPPDLMFAFKSG